MSTKPRKTIRYAELVREAAGRVPLDQTMADWIPRALEYWLCRHQIRAHRRDIVGIVDDLKRLDSMQENGQRQALTRFFHLEMSRHSNEIQSLEKRLAEITSWGWPGVDDPQRYLFETWVENHCHRWLELPEK